MTDEYLSSSTRAEAGATETAANESTGLKERAADAGGHMVGEVKAEVSGVTDETTRQAADLWSRARSGFSERAGAQQSRLATGLSSAAAQLTQMASQSDAQGVPTDLVREVGRRLDSAGRWLDVHDPDEVLDEVRQFARRRPGSFLLLAAGAGVVLGRLTRGLKDAPSARSTEGTPRHRTEDDDLPVYADPAQDRPRFTDELAGPVPTVPTVTPTAPVRTSAWARP
ncbi:hypothetical protein [Cellulomonas sp. URHE0023]|uniref:hypothetical protein n=1 Tax=Cellulomonas sp. URHE0023 TaxID=1380354 RepID=UPI00069016EF|nr:hypothetical protein [Cellulomonas sp. URHE0023]